MKLIPDKSELRPNECRDVSRYSALWNGQKVDNGGYMVHPIGSLSRPIPLAALESASIAIKNNQTEMLLQRVKERSIRPHSAGT